MNQVDFERLYEQVRDKAVRVALGVTDNRQDAEDAVQDVVLYFLERLDSNSNITASLFIQRVVQRAVDKVKPKMGRNKYEVAVGLDPELVLLEKQQMPERGRRTAPAKRAE